MWPDAAVRAAYSGANTPQRGGTGPEPLTYEVELVQDVYLQRYVVLSLLVILAFPLLAWLCGWLAERGFGRSPLRTLAAMSLGHALIFVFGVTWLAQLIGFEQAFATGVVPFWAATIAKTLLGVVTLPLAWKWIGRLK